MKKLALLAAVVLAGCGASTTTNTTTQTQKAVSGTSSWSAKERSWFVDGCNFAGTESDSFCQCALQDTVETFPNPKDAVSGIRASSMYDAIEAFGLAAAANADKFPGCS